MQDVFKYLDILVFVEATIYQMDEDNEKLCAEGEQSDQHVLNGKLHWLLYSWLGEFSVNDVWRLYQESRPFWGC